MDLQQQRLVIQYHCHLQKRYRTVDDWQQQQQQQPLEGVEGSCRCD
jgi:hypothetical protein